jgi:hypothetical protein
MTLLVCQGEGWWGILISYSGAAPEGNGKAKCWGLSTPQQTMKLSVAPVEMTPFLVSNRQKADPPPSAKDDN